MGCWYKSAWFSTGGAIGAWALIFLYGSAGAPEPTALTRARAGIYAIPSPALCKQLAAEPQHQADVDHDGTLDSIILKNDMAYAIRMGGRSYCIDEMAGKTGKEKR